VCGREIGSKDEGGRERSTEEGGKSRRGRRKVY